MNKIIGIVAIVIIAILLVTFAFADTPWEMPWGDEDMVDGTMTIEVYAIGADGSRTKIDKGLFAVFYSGVQVDHFEYVLTLSATTTYDDLSYIHIDFMDQKMTNFYSYPDCCPWESTMQSALLPGAATMYFLDNAGSVEQTSRAPLAGSFQQYFDSVHTGFTGEVWLWSVPDGSFTWRAFDVNDNPISEIHTFVTDPNDLVSLFFKLQVTDESLVTFNWDYGLQS